MSYRTQIGRAGSEHTSLERELTRDVKQDPETTRGQFHWFVGMCVCVSLNPVTSCGTNREDEWRLQRNKEWHNLVRKEPISAIISVQKTYILE